MQPVTSRTLPHQEGTGERREGHGDGGDPDPHTGPAASADVVFSEPIDLTTFDYHDVTLTRNGGPNLITSAVTVSYVGGSTYRISGLDALTTAAIRQSFSQKTARR